jgi:phosphatidylinositol 3-kinase
LKVELEDPTFGARYREVLTALEDRLSQTPFSSKGIRETRLQPQTTEDKASQFTKSIVDSVSKLGSSLRNADLHGGTTSERDKIEAKLLEKERTMWNVLLVQDKFISGVLDIQLRCRNSRGKKDAKEAELKSLLSKEGCDRKANREPVPLPSRPDIFVNGVRPETAIMFKSALYPALVEFHVEGTMQTKEHDVDSSIATYKVIIKTGDDLRQDQLIIMMIQLMDRLLKRGALDLCLTPYSIIATSTTSGLVEFVDKSMPISQVLSKFNGSIMQFFQSVASLKGAKYDVRPDVMSIYIRSCAGYCVITYLLGVGGTLAIPEKNLNHCLSVAWKLNSHKPFVLCCTFLRDDLDRHLDNIMLRTSGHFFHIDFGFIFGRDPKPLPPAFRLTREVRRFYLLLSSHCSTWYLTIFVPYVSLVDGRWYGWL